MKYAFGEVFVDKRRVDKLADGFMEAFVHKMQEGGHDAEGLYGTDLHVYKDINEQMHEACRRFQKVNKAVTKLPSPRKSGVFSDEFLQTQTLEACEEIILNAVKWMKPLCRAERTQFMGALALIVDGDVKFAVRVFEALVFCRDDAPYTFKLFTTLLGLSVSGALQMAGDPVHVLGWLYER